MSKYVLILILVSLVECEVKNKLRPRILGGAPCAIEKHPFVSSMRSRSNGAIYCGGSLIAPSWVMTAAHCVFKHNPRSFFIVAGTEKVLDIPQWTIRSISKFEINPQYSHSLKIHDIALISLETAYTIESGHLPRLATLPTSINYIEDHNCIEIVSAGWGNKIENDAHYKRNAPMQCVNLPLINIEECKMILGERNLENDQVCALYDPGGKDMCQGDSGGPLISSDGVVIGIVSKSQGCGRPGIPSINTRVDKHLDFIARVMTGKNCRNLPATNYFFIVFIINCIIRY